MRGPLSACQAAPASGYQCWIEDGDPCSSASGSIGAALTHPLSESPFPYRWQGSDGTRRILDIQPEETHQRLPLFLGSMEDIKELESYGDVQQVSKKTYNV